VIRSTGSDGSAPAGGIGWLGAGPGAAGETEVCARGGRRTRLRLTGIGVRTGRRGWESACTTSGTAGITDFTARAFRIIRCAFITIQCHAAIANRWIGAGINTHFGKDWHIAVYYGPGRWAEYVGTWVTAARQVNSNRLNRYASRDLTYLGYAWLILIKNWVVSAVFKTSGV